MNRNAQRMKASSEWCYLNCFNVKECEDGMGKEMAMGHTNKKEEKKNAGEQREEGKYMEVYVVNGGFVGF